MSQSRTVTPDPAGGYYIPPPEADLNERLRAVLGYITECKFVSLGDFLLKYFTSVDSYIQRQVGMFYSRGSFARLVDLWMSDTRTRIQITLLPAGKWIREALFMQLDLEMSALVRDPRTRRPAKDFEIIDWDNFSYRDLEMVYAQPAPTVMALVKFLCGAVTLANLTTLSEGTDISQGDSSQIGQSQVVEEGLELGAPELGLDPDAIEVEGERRSARDRSVLAITVMGILSYGRSRRSNILQVSELQWVTWTRFNGDI